jgi:hypothetical protein
MPVAQGGNVKQSGPVPPPAGLGIVNRFGSRHVLAPLGGLPWGAPAIEEARRLVLLYRLRDLRGFKICSIRWLCLLSMPRLGKEAGTTTSPPRTHRLQATLLLHVEAAS